MKGKHRRNLCGCDYEFINAMAKADKKINEVLAPIIQDFKTETRKKESINEEEIQQAS